MTPTLNKCKTFMLALIAVVLLAGIGGEAEAGEKKDKPDDHNKVSQSTCPKGVFEDFADASGRWVTYQAATPVQVCDRTTGKFWEQSPSTDAFTLDPDTATPHCAGLGPGWRLPGVQELVGIVDYTLSDPAVDTSVFSNILPTGYWSATPYASDQAQEWRVGLGNGLVFNSHKNLVGNTPVWCVRSGS